VRRYGSVHGVASTLSGVCGAGYLHSLGGRLNVINFALGLAVPAFLLFIACKFLFRSKETFERAYGNWVTFKPNPQLMNTIYKVCGVFAGLIGLSALGGFLYQMISAK
jgi:hypothetical protein